MAKMYLYNGVELPELPEWDKEKYPYAVIMQGSNLLYVFDKPVQKKGDSTYLSKSTGYGRFSLIRSSMTWSDFYDSGAVSSTSGGSIVALPIWANHNVNYYGNTVAYLAASDPIPVVSTVCITAPKPMFFGLMVGRRIAGQRKRV